MPTDALRGWVVTAIITAIGGIVRFWHLGYRTDGGTPLFDEKYYAVQAAEMVRNGGVEDNQAYGVIVHPPLGKQIIAIGELLFGYTPTGWRFASAVAGTMCILLIIRVTRRMTRSTLLGGIAGVLLICRRGQPRHGPAGPARRVLRTVRAGRVRLPDRRPGPGQEPAGPLPVGRHARTTSWPPGVPLGARWWRFGAGLSLGLATAVKWNGAYWIIAFFLLILIWDTLARRDLGLRSPVVAMFRRDFFPTVWSIAVIPVLTYLAAYWALVPLGERLRAAHGRVRRRGRFRPR